MLYELEPRIGSGPFSYKLFGPRFTLCTVNDGKELRLFLETASSLETLRAFFGVEKASLRDVMGIFGRELWVGDARVKREEDFFLSEVFVSDIAGLVNSLEFRGGICTGMSRDPELKKLFFRRASSLQNRASRYRSGELSIKAQEVRRRIPNVLLGKLLTLAESKKGLMELERLLEASSSVPLRFVNKRVKDEEALGKALDPPNLGGFWGIIFGERNEIIWDEESFGEVIKLPDPSLHRISFVRGSPLPSLIPMRMGKGSFRIGKLEDGREFRLSVEDLYRHAYLIGQTGSGKTTFLKLLVHRIHEIGEASVIVIDPHGDMTVELKREIPHAKFFHPTRAPFSMNPLELPRAESRDHAITLATDILLKVFKEVLNLTDYAVNVKYMLQVILRTLYQEKEEPTMADLYHAILGLYEGTYVLDVKDIRWKQSVEALQRMREQTFISALSRLEAYANDPLLQKLTGKTSINIEEIMKPGSLSLFSLPKAELGENVTRLTASTIVMKLWFEALARARLQKKRTPVFLMIDEFQFVADLPIIETILSEARKYGLHLIVAHQHTKQIPDDLLQSILTNCGVKVAFVVGGEDLSKLGSMDASFAESLSKALTGLRVGKAVVKMTARAGEQQPPPAVVEIDGD
ncbi:MAG: ATP-binding protein [Fervidicoccaceae archaeon]